MNLVDKYLSVKKGDILVVRIDFDKVTLEEVGSLRRYLDTALEKWGVTEEDNVTVLIMDDNIDIEKLNEKDMLRFGWKRVDS